MYKDGQNTRVTLKLLGSLLKTRAANIAYGRYWTVADKA